MKQYYLCFINNFNIYNNNNEANSNDNDNNNYKDIRNNND